MVGYLRTDLEISLDFVSVVHIKRLNDFGCGLVTNSVLNEISSTAYYTFLR